MNPLPDSNLVTLEFQKHYGLIVAVATRYAPTSDLVYDVVHQAYIDFMNAAMRGDWDPAKDSRPYLHEIVKNRAIDLWRQEKKRSTENMQKIGEMLLEQQQRQESDWNHEDERISLLNACLKTLGEKARELVTRHYFQQVSIEKIAEEMSLPSNSLRKTLSRIRGKLKDCISWKRETEQ